MYANNNLISDKIYSSEGYDLAHRANEEYDRKDELEMDLEDAYISPVISGVGHEALKKAHVAASHRFDQLQDAAGDKFDEVEFGASVETETTFEQKAETTKKALADQYEKYGAKPEDFSLVETQGADGEPVYTVIYSAPNGLDLGDPAKRYDSKRSYNAVMADDESHTVEINGEEVDTRNGITEAAYKAMVAYAKENDLPLPDSESTKDKGVRTATWLTGDRAGAGDARLAGVDGDGQVYAFWPPRDYDARFLRFRPAVVISK